jgi:hypothetical protein
MCWHSFIKQPHITTTSSRTSSFVAILESTTVGESPKVNQQRWTKVDRRPTCSTVNPVDQFRWKEVFTRFTLVDSTALIKLGDPCKRALTCTAQVPRSSLNAPSFPEKAENLLTSWATTSFSRTTLSVSWTPLNLYMKFP